MFLFCNCPGLLLITSSISFSLLVGPSSRFCSSTTSFLNYSQADYRSMCDFLLDWDFSACFLSLDVEFIWSEIKSPILEAINRFVLTATILKWHSHLPCWFDGSLRHNLKHVRTFCRKCVSHPTPTRLQNLARLESDLKDNIAIAESTYVSILIHQSAINQSPSRLYAHIRSVVKQSPIPSQVFLGSTSASSSKEQVDLFDNYFFSVFSPCSSYPSLLSLCQDLPRSSTMEEISISSLDVFQALSNLDPSKAMGADGICPQIL